MWKLILEDFVARQLAPFAVQFDVSVSCNFSRQRFLFPVASSNAIVLFSGSILHPCHSMPSRKMWFGSARSFACRVLLFDVKNGKNNLSNTDKHRVNGTQRRRRPGNLRGMGNVEQNKTENTAHKKWLGSVRNCVRDKIPFFFPLSSQKASRGF